MKHDFHKTLLFPFERGELDMPGEGQYALIIGALHRMELPDGWTAQTAWVQGFRPAYLALERAGLKVSAEIGQQDFDIALILCGRHRGQNEHWIAQALTHLRQGGVLLIAGGKNDGIDSLRKRIDGMVEIEGSLSKYHGTAFWFRAPSSIPEAMIAEVGSSLEKNADGFFAAPGMFSNKGADRGSKLLAETFPQDLKGTVADFGAGWGYLSAALIRTSSQIASLDVCEADHASLLAAKSNLGPLARSIHLRYFWIDLLQETTGNKYDYIVMNPPFHAGRAAEPDIGAGMITAASRALKPGGRLFMVANRNLPYEKTLGLSFSRFEEVGNADGFKVIHAMR